MPPAFAFFSRSLAVARPGARHRVAFGLLAILHLAALAILVWSETDFVSRAAFVLGWGLLNFLWLAMLHRPTISAALSLTLVIILILLSRFKHDVLDMTINFLDVMVIDPDTFVFLLRVLPGLAWKVGLAALVAVPAVAMIWRFDAYRIHRAVANLGCVVCFSGLVGLSFVLPVSRDDEFANENYLSKFVRSGAVAVIDLVTRGVFEADATVNDGMRLAAATRCQPAQQKRPHIIMVLDELSFDATMMPAVAVPPNYRNHFRSLDGQIRSLVVEGAGGPTWFAEYNVLTGLSVRSYGRFAAAVTRIAAENVVRGLPNALRRCGYRTFSIYPVTGAFLGARGFQTALGIEHFLDAKDLGTRDSQTDGFYYDFAARLIARERGDNPLFLLLYTYANHFPWDYRFRPDLATDWRDLGNPPFGIDEYLRRQKMSERDYAELLARLRRDFPDESFLMVRFGDHQPLFAKYFLEPGLDEATIAQRIVNNDPRYFTTYYAIDGVNFTPIDMSSALATLDAPYLPLVVLEAAGLPLGPTFAEQKKILRRCGGLFYLCQDGAEARRFNRLLIDAGLIKGTLSR